MDNRAWWEELVPNVVAPTRKAIEPTLSPHRAANGRLDETALMAMMPEELKEQAQLQAQLGNERLRLIEGQKSPELDFWGKLGGVLSEVSVPVAYAQGNTGYAQSAQGSTIFQQDRKRRNEYEDQLKTGRLKIGDDTLTSLSAGVGEYYQARNKRRLAAGEAAAGGIADAGITARANGEDSGAAKARAAQSWIARLRQQGFGKDADALAQLYPAPVAAAPAAAPDALANVPGIAVDPPLTSAMAAPAAAPSNAPQAPRTAAQRFYAAADEARAAGRDDLAKAYEARGKEVLEATKWGVVGQNVYGPVYGYPDALGQSAPTIPGSGAVTDKPLTIGEKAIDRNFAKTYEDDIAAGGLNEALMNIRQLKSVADRLEGKDPAYKNDGNITGPFVGMIPDSVRAFSNSPAVDIRNTVESVIQRSLRPILGAQFTEKEGERLIARAYNPQLEEAVNAGRLRNLLKATEGMAQAKLKAAEYFQENGTMRGYKGTTEFSLADIENAIEGALAPPRTSVDAETTNKFKSKYNGLE